MIPILDAITAGLRAFGEFMGFINKKTELNNTPEMKDAAQAQKDNDLSDKISQEVQTNNEDANRNDIAP